MSELPGATRRRPIRLRATTYNGLKMSLKNLTAHVKAAG
jgi:hypothetical protein